MQYFVRHNEIMGDLYIPEKETNNRIGLVWLPGLPNHPGVEDMGHPLTELGFTVLQPRYPGTWHSYGEFGPSSSYHGAILGLELLKTGSTVDLRSLQTISWEVDYLIVVGNSYGGAIAITTLGTTELADAAVVFCPLLDPAEQNSDPDQPEEDLSRLAPFLKRCYENVFRNLDADEWNHFIHGRHLCNPVNYIDALKDYPLLFLHGADDKSIRPSHTKEFYQKLKAAGSVNAEFILKENIGHGRKLRTSTRELWTDWMLRQWWSN